MKAKSGMAGVVGGGAAVVCGGLGVFEGTQAVVVMRAEGMHHAWVNLFFTILLGGCRGRWWLRWRCEWGQSIGCFKGSSLRGWLRHVDLWFAIWVGATTWNMGIEIWLNPWTPETRRRDLWNVADN